jgi:hypothetical protein
MPVEVMSKDMTSRPSDLIATMASMRFSMCFSIVYGGSGRMPDPASGHQLNTWFEFFPVMNKTQCGKADDNARLQVGPVGTRQFTELSGVNRADHHATCFIVQANLVTQSHLLSVNVAHYRSVPIAL